MTTITRTTPSAPAPERPRKPQTTRRRRSTVTGRTTGMRVAITVVALVVVFVNGFPFYWMALTSIKPGTEVFGSPPSLVTLTPDFSAYVRLFRDTTLLSALGNSLIVAIGTTVLSVTIAALAAYGLTRFQFRGSGTFSTAILYAYTFAPIVIVVPLYGMFRDVGLINSHFGLIIAYSSFGVPFALWLLRPFFAAMPPELEEAAFMDGATRWRSATTVVLPMAAPALIAVSVFTFLLAWEDYLFARVLITEAGLKTLPVALYDLFGASLQDWPLIMAFAVVINIPVLIGFFFAQKYLVSGWGAGAVK